MLGLEERVIPEDGPSGLLNSDLTSHSPTHPCAPGLLLRNCLLDLTSFALKVKEPTEFNRGFKYRRPPLEDDLKMKREKN